MFGAGRSGGTTTTPGRKGAFSVIGADVTITGDIAADSDVHIDGNVTGDIVCAALVQGRGSRIAGTVRASGARIAGAIDGSVDAETLTITTTARITGDVAYNSIEIENGARIDGRMRHRDGGSVSPDAPLRLVDASDEVA